MNTAALEKNTVRLLGLSTKEYRVLEALKSGHSTPLQIERATKVSRPAIYATLKRFKERGLVRSKIEQGRKSWHLAPLPHIESALYDTKKYLLDIPEGREEVMGFDDATVVIHRGKDDVRCVIESIMKEHKDQRFFAIQGDRIGPGWDQVFGLEGINDLNQALKKNSLISELIVPYGFFERQVQIQGTEWGEHFAGRAAISHEIDEAYFEHAGQVWIFKHSLYLIAMHEEVIIEIRNSETQKLVLEMFRFIQDNSRKFDVNARLRELIEKNAAKEEEKD